MAAILIASAAATLTLLSSSVSEIGHGAVHEEACAAVLRDLVLRETYARVDPLLIEDATGDVERLQAEWQAILPACRTPPGRRGAVRPVPPGGNPAAASAR
ncbi:hypothetical protein OPKNFCMD_4784 [Methylobacterium crusticola]|uniref:Uncharacterized protein n=2 Tax=Methylobacterium crusticola TaxID=1697972 RepID=A0ABQ4R3M9_9HYPH|nr:hypothetical protein OPKNFCMD_4784 [Methylobacterium crusticola]